MQHVTAAIKDPVMYCSWRAGDVRLYRETPAAATVKGRGSKGRGAKAKPPDAGAWELLADSLEALREAGEKLRRNKQRPEQRLASQVRHAMHSCPAGCPFSVSV